MKTMPPFVMPDPSASDAEESNMATAWEITSAEDKPVQKKMKIIRIAVVIPSFVPGGPVADRHVAKLFTVFDDEDCDDNEDHVGDATFEEGDAQTEALI